jgi:hypothetical protein
MVSEPSPRMTDSIESTNNPDTPIAGTPAITQTQKLSYTSLSAAFKAAVGRIDEIHRATDPTAPDLSSVFYQKMATCVFLTFWEALTDTKLFGRARKRLHVISAPAGSGKTTFSNACIAALVGMVPNTSALVVVEQIKTAKTRYAELEALLPGKVACWTSEFATVGNKDELANYPVAIVTHAMFSGKSSQKARRWQHGSRTITVVDERIKEVAIYDATPTAVSKVWEIVNSDGSERARAALDALNKFVAARVCERLPLDRLADVDRTEEHLQWFKSEEARRYARDHDVAAVFGFAKSLADNYAFISGEGNETHLIGYENTMEIDPGTLLLDATADLDGVQQLCLPGRKLHSVPPVTYDGLQTVLVKPSTRARLSEHLRKHENAVAYRDWAVEVIKQHVEPGQRALVVCRLDLTEQKGRYLPDWPREDRRWNKLKDDPTGFHWNVGKRQIAVTYWGADNIGNNAWQTADVVILLDADYKPRRVVVADTQGMLNAHPDMPNTPLAEMTSVRRKHATVDGYALGGLLRAHKQLALRGKARHFDEQGRCGQQKVVCGLADPKWLLENFTMMFPRAAPIKQVTVKVSKKDGKHTKGNSTAKGKGKDRPPTYAEQVLLRLADPSTPDPFLPKDLNLGRPWRLIAPKLMTQPFKASLAAIGWEYVSKRGVAAEFRRT